jgi:peptidyl-prolyl cis-trans isomerase A (cyclophilin A)
LNKRTLLTSSLSSLLVSSSFVLMTAFSAVSHATVVEVRTVVGNFQVNLFDETTPQTVENFLEYVNSGAYASNVVHRSANNFVVQMGGFAYANEFPPNAIATGTPVNNEPELSNVRGTLAMAKVGGNPNSATSQFFVNLANNSSNLDVQNGGFSVFGQVLGDGMDVVDTIAALPRFNFGGAFGELPLQNYSTTDANNSVIPTDENLVIITDIVVIDDATVTNPDINPVRNTLINSTPTNPQVPDSDGGGGGTFGFGVLCLLGIVAAFRTRRHVKAN